jgi:hypothetical protein
VDVRARFEMRVLWIFQLVCSCTACWFGLRYDTSIDRAWIACGTRQGDKHRVSFAGRAIYSCRFLGSLTQSGRYKS